MSRSTRLPDKTTENEENYIDNVDYFLRVMSLMTNAEVESIKACWSRICASEDFFDTVFSRLMSEKSELFDSVKEIFCDEDLFSGSNRFVKEHNAHMIQIINLVMESLKTPDAWMVGALRAATIHMLYAVSVELMQAFRSVTMDTLKEVMAKDLTPMMEDSFGRFLDCLVGILDPLNETVSKT